MACRAIEPGAESKAPYMIYLCECGKKWDAPISGTLVAEGAVWMCVCGRTLSVRRGVIHAARMVAARRPHFQDRELAGLAGGETANTGPRLVLSPGLRKPLTSAANSQTGR